MKNQLTLVRTIGTDCSRCAVRVLDTISLCVPMMISSIHCSHIRCPVRATDGAPGVHIMRRTHLGPVLSGGWRLLLARIVPAVLRVLVAAGPAAVVFSARAPGLLQGRLCQVCIHTQITHTPHAPHTGVRARTGSAFSACA